MTATPKIYRVTIHPPSIRAHTRYVRAHTRAGAERHVAKDSISASMATQDDIVRFVTAHGAAGIEDATGETDDGTPLRFYEADAPTTPPAGE